MFLLETQRLSLRQFTLTDAPFVLELVNEPAWLRFIGDRGVKTLADAEAYLRKGPLTSYTQNGFGLYLVELKDSHVPIGMCGLIKRDGLDDVDIGFAFLTHYWGYGYASEAASAVLRWGSQAFGLKRLVAIVDPENSASIHVLQKIGMRFERMIRLSADDIELKLFALDF